MNRAKAAREEKIQWTMDESMTDEVLGQILFLKETKVSFQKRMPEFEYIRSLKRLIQNAGFDQPEAHIAGIETDH